MVNVVSSHVGNPAETRADQMCRHQMHAVLGHGNVTMKATVATTAALIRTSMPVKLRGRLQLKHQRAVILMASARAWSACLSCTGRSNQWERLLHTHRQ
jgi:hypothetical protein